MINSSVYPVKKNTCGQSQLGLEYIRDAFQKKVHMEGNCPNLTLLPTPLQKQGTKQQGTFFGFRPPPPLKTREICWIFLDVLKSMNFGSKLFQTALTTIHLQTEVNKSLLGLRGDIIQQIFKHFNPLKPKMKKLFDPLLPLKKFPSKKVF